MNFKIFLVTLIFMVVCSVSVLAQYGGSYGRGDRYGDRYGGRGDRYGDRYSGGRGGYGDFDRRPGIGGIYGGRGNGGYPRY